MTRKLINLFFITK